MIPTTSPLLPLTYPSLLSDENDCILWRWYFKYVQSNLQSAFLKVGSFRSSICTLELQCSKHLWNHFITIHRFNGICWGWETNDCLLELCAKKHFEGVSEDNRESTNWVTWHASHICHSNLFQTLISGNFMWGPETVRSLSAWFSAVHTLGHLHYPRKEMPRYTHTHLSLRASTAHNPNFPLI